LQNSTRIGPTGSPVGQHKGRIVRLGSPWTAAGGMPAALMSVMTETTGSFNKINHLGCRMSVRGWVKPGPEM
jgi:hypothetical protein